MVLSKGAVIDGPYVCPADSYEGIAVTRSFGDIKFKTLPTHFLSSKPHFSRIERSSDLEFLLIACDGLWNLMDPQTTCNWVWEQIRDGVRLKWLPESLYYTRYLDRKERVEKIIRELQSAKKDYSKYESDHWWQWPDNVTFLFVFMSSFPFLKYPYLQDVRSPLMTARSINKGRDLVVYREYITLGDAPYVFRWKHIDRVHLLHDVPTSSDKKGLMIVIRLNKKIPYLDVGGTRDKRDIFKVVVYDPPEISM